MSSNEAILNLLFPPPYKVVPGSLYLAYIIYIYIYLCMSEPGTNHPRSAESAEVFTAKQTSAWINKFQMQTEVGILETQSARPNRPLIVVVFLTALPTTH